MISESQVDAAMHYLAETDEPHAKAKSLAKGREHALKTIRAQAFLDAAGGVGEREQIAYASHAYRAAVDRYTEAVYELEILENKRLRAQLTIDLWRTLEASRRAK